MSRVWGWAARNQFLAAIVLFTVVVAGAFARDAYREVKKDRFVDCVASWADATSARTGALGAPNAARDDAQDALWRDFAAQLSAGSRDVEGFKRKLADYVTASDDVKAAREAHPVPDPPRIRC